MPLLHLGALTFGLSWGARRHEVNVSDARFYRLIVAFGYMEEPLLAVLQQAAQASGIPLDLANTTFYVGTETIIVHDEATIHRIPEAIFSYLNRNAVHDERRYGMPLDQVVEIG